MANEDRIVLRLRALIFVIFGLGIAAAVAGNGDVRFFVVCFFIPGGAAYIRPRWPAIVIWIMWASTIGLLGFLLALGGVPDLLHSPSLWLMGTASALLFIAMPLVRRMGEAPPMLRGRARIPEARIHHRDS
jgi:hypothetical protein